MDQAKTCSQVLAYLGCIHKFAVNPHSAPSRGEGGDFHYKWEFPPSMPCMAADAVHLGCKYATNAGAYQLSSKDNRHGQEQSARHLPEHGLPADEFAD